MDQLAVAAIAWRQQPALRHRVVQGMLLSRQSFTAILRPISAFFGDVAFVFDSTFRGCMPGGTGLLQAI
jgi:hypothetical protein